MVNNIEGKIKELWNRTLKYFENFKEDLNKIKEDGLNKLLRKRKFEFITIVTLALFMIFIISGFFGESKEKLLSDFRKSLIQENYKELSKILKVNDEKVNYQELEPITKYYSGEENEVNNIINELRKSGKYNNFSIKYKKTFLNEKYWIDLNTIEVKFKTNTPGVEIEFANENKVIKDEIEINVIPGLYECGYKLKTEYGDIDGIINVKSMEDTTVDIDVPAIYITLYSNFQDARVFIDNKDINKTVGEIKKYGPIPKNRNISIYVERDFPWGKIKSEINNINEENYIKADINMVNDVLMGEIEKSVNEFYNSCFEAVNNNDISLIKNSTEDSKEKVYSYIDEKSFILKNNYEITDLNVEIEKSDFKYEEEKYKASLVTKINYNIFKKLLPFIKTPSESSFLLSLEFNEGSWVINDIQKFEIEN